MSEPYNIEDQYITDVFNRFPRLRQWSEGMTMIDVYRQLLSVYPLGSKAWMKFREIHVDFLRSTCENEYVLYIVNQIAGKLDELIKSIESSEAIAGNETEVTLLKNSLDYFVAVAGVLNTPN